MSSIVTCVICFLLILSSCSLNNTLGHSQDTSKVISQGTLLLVPPQEGPNQAIFKQTLKLIADDHERELIAVLKLTSSHIRLRALLPTGQLLYSLDYDGSALTQKNLSPMPLPAEQILSMIQFALWPLDSLKHHYRGEQGWQIKHAHEMRTLAYLGEKKLTVHYLPNRDMLLENHASQYKVNIETLEYRPL